MKKVTEAIGEQIAPDTGTSRAESFRWTWQVSESNKEAGVEENPREASIGSEWHLSGT